MPDWVGTGLGLVGLGLGLYSAKESSDAAAEQGQAQGQEIRATAAKNKVLSDYDASVAEKEALELDFRTAQAVTQNARLIDRLLSGQRAAYGKSGVVVGTGTPLEVIAQTGASAAKDAEMIRYNGLKASERKRSLAKRFRLLGDAGLRTSLAEAAIYEDVATDRSQAFKIEGAANLAGQAFELWDNWG